MRTTFRSVAALVVGLGALLAATAPGGAITGGVNDDPLDPTYPQVGVVRFYQPDGRFRCSGTLIAPRVFLTAAHCTYQVIGKVVVTFDTQVALDRAHAQTVEPRAIDDPGDGLKGSDYTDGLWIVPFDDEGNPVPEERYEYDNTGFADSTADDAPVWRFGTAVTHPEYSDFTDMKNWNDTGVVILDEPITDIPVSPLAPEGYLDELSQPELAKTLFRTVGYGTEVRPTAESGPQNPVPQSYPIRRQYTDEKGQKLTDQILQMNGNEHDPFGGGGTCFGDSGGPAFLDGFVVGDTSYGYTSNCRYLGGYQRVDIPVVRDWLLDCLADLACPTKG